MYCSDKALMEIGNIDRMDAFSDKIWQTETQILKRRSIFTYRNTYRLTNIYITIKTFVWNHKCDNDSFHETEMNSKIYSLIHFPGFLLVPRLFIVTFDGTDDPWAYLMFTNFSREYACAFSRFKQTMHGKSAFSFFLSLFVHLFSNVHLICYKYLGCEITQKYHPLIICIMKMATCQIQMDSIYVEKYHAK